MNQLRFFGHEGEDHSHAVSLPLPPELLVSGVAALIVLVVWFATFKLRLATRVMLITAVLLLTGVTCFEIAPITSTITLSAGMALTLASTLLQLAAAKHSARGRPRA